MPSPSPIIEERLWIRIESVTCCATHAATPSDSAIERMPTPSGRVAATTLPKASSRSSSVNGSTRSSAERASSELERLRSEFSGATPVQPSHAFGCAGRSFAVSVAGRGAQARQQRLDGLAARVEANDEEEAAAAVRGRARRPCRASERIPATPGTLLARPPTIVSRISLPPGSPNAGSPSATRITRLVNGERKRFWRSLSTAWAWPPGMSRGDLETILELARPRDQDHRDERPDHDDRPAVTDHPGRPAREPRSEASPRRRNSPGRFAARLSTRRRIMARSLERQELSSVHEPTQVLEALASLPALSALAPLLHKFARGVRVPSPAFRRVRPSDPGWPSPESWADAEAEGRRPAGPGDLAAGALRGARRAARRATRGSRSSRTRTSWASRRAARSSPAGSTGGRSSPSVYAVAARTTEDVVAAVNFAREHKLRLVVKGGGHSYLGTSERSGLASALDARHARDHAARRVRAAGLQRPAAGRGHDRSRRALVGGLRRRDDAQRPLRSGRRLLHGRRDRAAFRAEASAASRRCSAWPRRACSRPRS